MLKQDKTVIQITLFFLKKKFYYDSFILSQHETKGENYLPKKLLNNFSRIHRNQL